MQSELLNQLSKKPDFELAAGPSTSIRFPEAGPYDHRLGYTDLPRFIGQLEERAYRVEQQARLSETHLAMVEHGVFPIYQQRTQGGLVLLDRSDKALFEARFPERIYPDFESIPPLVVDTLLFIENRELLDPTAPRRNPAVEWDRLLALIPSGVAKLLDPAVNMPGASTLATQIEKYRHSPSGRTDDVGYNGQIAVDGHRQIITAQRLTTNGADYGALAPLVDNTFVRCGRKPKMVSADAGFCNEHNLAALAARGIAGYLMPGRARHHQPGDTGCRAITPGSLLAAMKARLRRARRRSRYHLRKQIVEPVFGQIKAARGFDKAQKEWALVCAVHNLTKLVSHRLT